jgi:hypothetical protein
MTAAGQQIDIGLKAEVRAMSRSGVVIREVHEDLIAPTKEFLGRQEEFGQGQSWEGLFRYNWKKKEYPYGYAALDGERVVGFIGTIFSERVVQGKKVPYCNITTWAVDADYRAMLLGLRLLEPIFKRKDVLITSLTPSDSSRDISEKMGFKLLEEEQVSVPILPRLWPMPGQQEDRRISFDREEIGKQLEGEDRTIFEDHRELDCVHFLIKERDKGLYCYGIGTTSVLRRLRFLGAKWLNLCYLSNAEVFERNLPNLRNSLLKRGRFLLLRYDSRLIPERLSRIEFRDKRARQFKSKEFSSCKVDNLYSELVTFNKY